MPNQRRYKSGLQRMIEEQHGKPLPDVLRELYTKHHSWHLVSIELRAPYPTVWRWRQKYHIETPMWEPEPAEAF